ncbi:hypothetical protein YC2023_008184 [Brassica napus]
MHLKTCYIISGDQNLEANLIDHEVNDSSSVPQTKNYKKWLRVSIYVFLVLTCQALSTILGRLYYENGGKSTWMVTVLQRIGFPLLFLYKFFSLNKQQEKTDPSFINTTLVLAYICLGLLASAISYMSWPLSICHQFHKHHSCISLHMSWVALLTSFYFLPHLCLAVSLHRLILLLPQLSKVSYAPSVPLLGSD